MKKALIFLAVAAFLIGIVWWRLSPEQPAPGPGDGDPASDLTVEELQSLIQRKNLAVGQLENGKLGAFFMA